MPDPTTYAGFAAGTWPENAPTVVNQNTMRNFIGPTARFLMNLPQVATPYAGQPLMARDGFFAEILHAGSGALQLSLGLSGVANQRPDQKLGVAPGLAVTVLLHGVRLFILGAAV
jgi:CBS-domain-containing membrane protein